MTNVYLDNAATTRPAAEVLEVMTQTASADFANPSSAHAAGAAAARVLEQARHDIAGVLGCESARELIFTSGGTEANALAILGAAARARGRHIIIGAIEHPAVLRNAERLAKQAGFEITLVAPDAAGTISPASVAAALRPDTELVAVMLVNNELGTVQPAAAIARALAAHSAAMRPRPPHFHVDAVQAFGLLSFRPALLGADSLAISGHKIHGPKGVGALWIRPGARVAPLWDGGGQEGGMRPGSENLPAITGFARAATLAVRARSSGAPARIASLRDELEDRIRAGVAGARLTVSADARAPHISSLSFPGLPAEPLLHALEARGVMASAGSACASRVRGPSHVLKAIGVGDDVAVLRFSLSRDTTSDEIRNAAQAVSAAVAEIAPTAKPDRRHRDTASVSRRGSG
jgi:cysteine desulfurase